MPHPGRRLREAFEKRTIMVPGAFNALVARAVAQAGFEACYISGATTANSAGYPDVGLITLTEMTRTIREVADASGLPVIVDADTGYAEGPEMMVRTTIEYERAGAAAMHVEDQVFPKRCGHLEGKTLIPTDDMVEKLTAAVQNRLSDDFIIIARTDARSVTGIDDAIDRASRYRKAGADMIFPEGLQSEEEFELFAKRCPGLLLANMTEFGKTPDIPAGRLAELGYQCVIYPVTMQRLAMGCITQGLDILKKQGSASDLISQMQTRAELYELLDYTPGTPWMFPGTRRA